MLVRSGAQTRDLPHGSPTELTRRRSCTLSLSCRFIAIVLLLVKPAAHLSPKTGFALPLPQPGLGASLKDGLGPGSVIQDILIMVREKNR